MSFLFNFVKRHWALIIVLIIVILGFYVRTLDYRWPYLRNIDSYALFRQMDEIVMNGGIAPTFDPLILAPVGAERAVELYPYQYLAAWSFMFFRIFFTDLQLWQYLVFFPAMIGALAAIPMYYIGKILYDRKAGVLAAFFIVFDISNFSRSLAGDPDTDAIVIMFPLIVMALFLYAYKYIDTKKVFDKKAILYTIIVGISLALWSNIWVGYWYIIWLISGFIIIKILINIATLRKIKSAIWDTRHLILSYAIFIIILLITIMSIYGSARIAYTFTGPIEFQKIKAEEGRDFPNVYVSVAELQSSGDIKDIIQRASAVNFSQNPVYILISPFFLMIYGLIYLFYSFIKKRQHIDTAFLLLIWFIGPLTATIIAVRFSILFSAPIAIGSAIILSKSWRLITGEDKKFED